MTFQELILYLERFWADRGCLIQQDVISSLPFDITAWRTSPANSLI